MLNRQNKRTCRSVGRARDFVVARRGVAWGCHVDCGCMGGVRTAVGGGGGCGGGRWRGGMA